MFRDAAYVKWANESTVHVLSYSLDKEAPGPEPVVEAERERDGVKEKVEVLVAYPMFTLDEAESLVNEVNGAVKFTMKTPWAGVVAPDGTTILAQAGKATAAQYREMYEEQSKKMGASVPRPVWRKVVAAIDASAQAEFDEAWRKAVESALAARDAVKDPPKALAERIETRVLSLDAIGKRRLEAAQATADPAARARAVAQVRADFAGLPFLAAAKR